MLSNDNQLDHIIVFENSHLLNFPIALEVLEDFEKRPDSLNEKEKNDEADLMEAEMSIIILLLKSADSRL